MRIGDDVVNAYTGTPGRVVDVRADGIVLVRWRFKDNVADAWALPSALRRAA